MSRGAGGPCQEPWEHEAGWGPTGEKSHQTSMDSLAKREEEAGSEGPDGWYTVNVTNQSEDLSTVCCFLPVSIAGM